MAQSPRTEKDLFVHMGQWARHLMQSIVPHMGHPTRGQLLPTSTREQVFGKINGEDAILRLSSNESNRREAPMGGLLLPQWMPRSRSDGGSTVSKYITTLSRSVRGDLDMRLAPTRAKPFEAVSDFV